MFGVAQTAYPHAGSGVVSLRFGNPWAPPGNLPPPDLDDDPHDKAHGLTAHNEQTVHFFRTGEIADFCGGDGCTPSEAHAAFKPTICGD